MTHILHKLFIPYTGSHLISCCISGKTKMASEAAITRMYNIKYEGPDWMANLPEKLWDLPLNHLAIPGSHDSFSFTRDKECDKDRNSDPFYRHFVDHFDSMANDIAYRWSVTQTKNLTEQLDLGVRYFDLRFTARADDHHIYYRNGANVLYALKEFRDWTKQHPKEVLIIDFRELHQVSENQHKKLLSEITREAFVDRLLEYTGNMQAVTLRNMWGTDTQVIVIYPNENIYRFSSMWPSDNVISYVFPDAQTTEQLISNLNVKYEESREPDKFCCYQGIMTPNKQFLYLNLEKTLKDTMSLPATRAVSNWVKGKFIREMQMNIVLADHVDKFDFCTEVIRCNYGQRIVDKYDFEKSSNYCTVL